MRRCTNLSRVLPLLISFSLILFTVASKSHAQVSVEQSPNGAVVKIDGQLFTEYIVESGGKPILWPIIGPTGKPMTRAYPMKKDDPTEKTDHPHHRSLWFTHGKVNGIDFWTEKNGNGTVKHREFVKLQSGNTGLIVTNNDWLSSDGQRQCQDKRTLRFGAETDCRWIDFNITIQALDKPVTFGDTKEGSFGLRLAETLSVDAKRGGQIVNSIGQLNNDTWGKTADWVDCHGPLDGQTVGIAIFNHPASFRYPTCWHVRGYGLFAANPFGLRDFSGDKKKDGSYTIQPEESITLRYRVLLHRGNEKVGKVAEAFSSYAKQEE
ncbi:MAG: PmoA family protein [Thermoguttaceae bacterium]|jgi:hypothetical protein